MRCALSQLCVPAQGRQLLCVCRQTLGLKYLRLCVAFKGIPPWSRFVSVWAGAMQLAVQHFMSHLPSPTAAGVPISKHDMHGSHQLQTHEEGRMGNSAAFWSAPKRSMSSTTPVHGVDGP